LFKEQRHLKGKVLIRQREKSDNVFFIKKGEIEVKFVYSDYDINRKIELGKATLEELER
jgi:CRP-like cAMP-binding protein